MYKTAELLNTTPPLIRYIAQKNKWKRPVPHLQRAVAKGNMYPNFYLTVELTEEDLKQHEKNRERFVPRPYDFYGG